MLFNLFQYLAAATWCESSPTSTRSKSFIRNCSDSKVASWASSKMMCKTCVNIVKSKKVKFLVSFLLTKIKQHFQIKFHQAKHFHFIFCASGLSHCYLREKRRSLAALVRIRPSTFSEFKTQRLVMLGTVLYLSTCVLQRTLCTFWYWGSNGSNVSNGKSHND